MAPKRKNGSGSVMRVTRAHVDTTQCHDRVVSVYRTATGRLAQSTTFITRSNAQPSNDSLDPRIIDSLPQDIDHPQQDQPKEPSKQSVALMDWAQHHRQTYLDEMIRHDGRAGERHFARCGGDGLYKCKDCFGFQLLCKGCIEKAHSYLPFHRILQWTGEYFDDVSLISLGIKVFLGHGGDPCKASHETIKGFVVIDINGIHRVDIHFCGCYEAAGASHHRIQLLRVGLLPATTTRPRCAFTFDILDTFHLLTLQGKVSAYDFYLSVARKSDNTGNVDIKYRYEQFLSAIRMWRHLKLIKRAGRGHVPDGISTTKLGECAVECPACPHPQRNIPASWDLKPPDERWLYSLILTVDANFRLKNKEKNFKGDYPLGDGWGHWVSQAPYKEYVRKYGYQVEPNLCGSELHAVDHAHTKFSKGYRATGVGGVICARHGLVRKNGLGDLQKGERYANMDFLVLSTLINVAFTLLVISYDIACQWSRNLKKRIPQFPSDMQPPSDVIGAIKYVIPKFHIYGHGISCQTRFSLNYLKHSARTDGEDPERFWAHVNPLSMSTREMGPGSRLDTIDDHAAAWNWRKVTNFGDVLCAQLQEAVKMKRKHDTILKTFTAKFAPEVVEKWVAMIETWDLDQSKPNPYDEPQNSITMAQVRLELAKEDLEYAKAAGEVAHEVSANVFLQVGLELEEQQRQLKHHLQTVSSTSQDAETQAKRSTLHNRIKKWQTVQSFYMPAVSEHQARKASDDVNAHPEKIPLYLPSEAPRGLCPSTDLVEKETRLRLAQASDSLNELRRLLRITLGLWDYKYTQLGPSQRAATRARSLINRYREKTDRVVARYQAAWSALCVLDPGGSWSHCLHELKPEDVKGPGRGKDDISEGRRQVSWIWLASECDKAATEEEIGDSLRVEWVKSRARAARWSEEVLLIVEEMRRVLCFLLWKVESWNQQKNLRTQVRPDIAEGLAGYAVKQAAVVLQVARRFSRQWYSVLMMNGLAVEWPQQFLPGDSIVVVQHVGVSEVADDVPLSIDDDVD